MDFESLLLSVLNSRLTNQVNNASQNTERESRGMPNSTRRAFESRMKADARVARMASQNMEDAKSMVNVAQTNVTAMKSQFQSIREMLAQAAYSDSFTPDMLGTVKNIVTEHAAEIERLAKNTEFNGMKLFDGSHDTVQLQAGESVKDQVFMNLLDGSGTVSGQNTMDLSKTTIIRDLVGYTERSDGTYQDSSGVVDKSYFLDKIDKVEKYIERMQSLEAQYSYDYKSLDNLSILFEEQADIYDKTWERSANGQSTATSTSKASILSELLSSGSSSILSGVS